MRRYLLLTAVLTAVAWRPAIAGPGSASGPITVDSTTYVPGSSVMGTDGGVYGDSIPPVASTTTAAFRMTKYRALHVNLRDNSGAELGTVGNPLYTTASSSITIGNVTVSNSSFSVTGSTVVVAQPTAANLNATVVQGTPGNLKASVSISGSSNTVQAVQSGTWNVNNTQVGTSSVTVIGTPNVAVTNTPTVTVGTALPAGTNNIGTVTNSTVTVRTASGVPIATTVGNTVGVTLSAAVPAGTNNIGTVSGSSVTIATSGGANLPVALGAALPAGSNVIGQITVLQQTPTALKASVPINPMVDVWKGVSAAQSGSWTNTVTQGTASNLHALVAIDTSSNTVQAQQSGAWAVSSTPVGTSTVTFNGVSQPVTPSQSTPANLQVSASINGSSNTVTANQGGSWTATATQGTNSNLRASVAIDGSSNTVVLGGGTANVGKILFQTPTTASLSNAVINFSAAGDNVVVSTVSLQTVRVYRILFTATTATTFTFKSGGSTALSGVMSLAANGSVVLDFTGEPWYITTAGQAFIINQTGTAQISGTVWYTQS